MNNGKQTKLSLAGKRQNPFRRAYDGVPRSERVRGFTMLACAGVTTAVLFASRLFWLFKPLLDKIYYGTLSEVVYYIFLFVLCTVYSIFLARYVYKHCGERLYSPVKKPMTIPRVLAIIAIAAVTVFVTSAAFRFKTKIQLEMGSGVTMATALTNIAVYFYYAFHMWLGISAAILVQRGLTVLFPAKHTVPWGVIFLVTVYGLLELALEIWTTSHAYPWMYYAFTYVYAAIFVMTEGRFLSTYWTSVIIMVL